MESSGQENYVFSGKERQVKQSFEELKANHPRVFGWFKLIRSYELTDTAFKNYAARFGMSAEELKWVINEFEKGSDNG